MVAQEVRDLAHDSTRTNYFNDSFGRKPPRDVGALYMHRISDPKMTAPPEDSISKFEKLCAGYLETPHFPLKTVVVTTMWEKGPTPEMLAREAELGRTCQIIRDGLAPMCRFLDTQQSAEAAVSLLLNSGSDASD